MATPGAAMCTPTIAVDPSCTTENASSISVVALSSTEKATTGASGSSSGSTGGGRSWPNPVPFGKCEAMKLSTCHRYGDAIAPVDSSSFRGVVWSSSAACSTALYSIEFLSGFTSRPIACCAIAAGACPAFSADTCCCFSSSCCRLRSSAARAAFSVSAGAAR